MLGKINENESSIRVSNYGKTIIIEHDHDDVMLDEWIHDFVTLMKGITFDESQIIHWLKKYIEEYEEE